MFSGWLAATRDLQRRAYDVDFDAMTDEQRVGYIRWNVWAAFVELGEFSQALPLKPWATGSAISLEARNQAVEELVDLGHFAANLACALGCNDKEYERRYRTKMDENERRQRDGYHNRGVAERQVAARS